METSIFLARVIGLFSVIASLAILVHYKEFLKVEKEASKNFVLLYVSGFAILIIGLLVVVSHPVFTSDWRVVITLLGYAILLKGILRIFSPEFVIRMIEKKQNNRWFILGEIVLFCIGIYLLYYGFVI